MPGKAAFLAADLTTAQQKNHRTGSGKSPFRS